MIPVSPVIPSIDTNEVIVAEKQAKYQNLPSICLEGGIILCRWKMTDEEREVVAQTGDVYLYQWTGGKFVTPMLLQVETPVVPDAPEYRDVVLEAEIVEADVFHSAQQVFPKDKPKYRIRCSFGVAAFEWGMEDGVFNDDLIIERNAENHPVELRSEMYPGYLKADEIHFGGKGIKHSEFGAYIETHKGKVRIDETIWIVTNPNGDKEVYEAEDFHEIYSLENA